MQRIRKKKKEKKGMQQSTIFLKPGAAYTNNQTVNSYNPHTSLTGRSFFFFLLQLSLSPKHPFWSAQQTYKYIFMFTSSFSRSLNTEIIFLYRKYSICLATYIFTSSKAPVIATAALLGNK